MLLTKPTCFSPLAAVQFKRTQLRQVRTKCLNNEALYTPFFNAYSQLICEYKSSCIDHAIIPPYLEQVDIMKTFTEISTHVDISRLEGVVLKSLITHDIEHLNELLVLLQEHSGIVNAIQLIVQEIK